MIKSTLLTAAALLALAAPAMAENPIGRFARVYDRAHLTTHPDQLVKEVDLLLKKSSTRYYSHDFSLRMKLRGRDETLRTEGACRSEESGLECIVECDGGGVRIEPRGDHVMMYLDRIRMITCDQNLLDDGEEVGGGKDDRVFRLNRIGSPR